MSNSSGRNRRVGLIWFILGGLAVALLIGMVISYFAASTPDALQRSVISSACENAADKEACLGEQEGTPVLQAAPQALLGYQVGWLSGLVGVIVAFAIGTGLAFLGRRSGGSRRTETSERRVE